MKRKKYSPEFKREAIELVRRSGASCRQVALEIGVVRISEHCDRPFRLIVTGHFANA